VTAHGDDRQLRGGCAHEARGLHAVEYRHLDVHDDGVGPDPLGQVDRFLPVASTAGQGEPVVLLEDERDDVEERLVVLGDENPEWTGQVYLLLATEDEYPSPPDGNSGS
jgi:hypothetical protein